ncbi:protein phosphatase 1L isoform X2 [Bemisia tabaci]|uniref:protein phosphatase 1L isoform X2 n=1 Tax=Bemisia tabaci TaxID=7038 RepID=UPI003B27E837
MLENYILTLVILSSYLCTGAIHSLQMEAIRLARPCYVLSSNAKSSDLDKANSCCMDAANLITDSRTDDAENKCPNSQNAKCSPKHTHGGLRYRCTVEVPNPQFQSPPWSSSRLSPRLGRIPRPSFNRSFQTKELSSCFSEPVKDSKHVPFSEFDFDLVDEKSWETVGKSAAVFAIQGRRKKMEDRFIVRETTDVGVSIFAIFDGHSGEFAVKYAEDNLVPNIISKIKSVQPKQKFKRTLSWPSPFSLSFPSSPRKRAILSEYVKEEGIDYEQILEDVIIATDAALLDEARKVTDPKFKAGGTTALLALFDGLKLYVANVGDSRGVMCDASGETVLLSVDHKPDLKGEEERIKAAGGTVMRRNPSSGTARVDGKLAMSRSLGDMSLKDKKLIIPDPTIKIFDLSNKPQFIIMASDGLWDRVTNEKAVEFIKTRLDEPHFGAKSLAHFAYFRKSSDNITVMVIKFKGHVWLNRALSRSGSRSPKSVKSGRKESP